MNHPPRAPRYPAPALAALVALVALAAFAGCGEATHTDASPADAAPADASADADAGDAAEAPREPVVAGNARFTVLTDALIRLEYADDGAFEDRPSQLVGRRPELAAPFEATVDGDAVVIETAALTLRYVRDSGPFSDANLTVTYRLGDQAIVANPRWGPLERTPESLGGWLRGLDLVAERQPLRPGLLSREGWTLLDDTDTALLVDDGQGYVVRPERVGAYQDGYFLGYGRNYRQALADLRHLTGPAPLLPRTALGVWFSRYYAYSAEEWRQVVEAFEQHGVPLDVLSLDTDWKRPAATNFCAAINSVSGARPDDPCSWNGWDWNDEIFPDPAGFLSWVRDRGIDVGLNIHPSINAGEAEFAAVEGAGAQLDADISVPSCQLLQADVSNDCLVFDLLDQTEVDAYFALHDPVADAGIDFWWFDWCCERTGQLVPGLANDTWINQLYHAEHRAMGSRWPAFSRIGSALQAPEEAVTSLGALAEHRQTLHFTGDTCSTWELLDFAAAFTVAEGAMGLPYVSHDIGSFHGELAPGTACDVSTSNPRMSDEMYVRWIQFGTFQPLNRLHSNHGDRLPWEYPGQAEAIASEFLRLRGRLVPHLYTLSRQAHDLGLPLTRALYLSWPDIEDAYAYPAHFTLGDDLLVAVVAATGPDPTIDVWIPPGAWHHFFTGETYTGPQVVSVQVPLDQYAVFARAGSILPLQPDLPTSRRGPQDDLTLAVHAGGDGSYTLYEDEGVGFAYEQGAFRRTPITSASANGCHVVTIGAFEGASFPGALDTRSWTVELRGADDPAVVSVGGEALADGAWTWDADARTVRVSLGPVAADTPTSIAFGSGCE